MNQNPEQIARDHIDQMLVEAGWVVQSFKQKNLAAGVGVAIREYITVGQWNVKVSTCREIPFPIFPVEEQQQIIQEIESRLSVCDKIEETIITSLQQAEPLKQRIFKKRRLRGN